MPPRTPSPVPATAAAQTPTSGVGTPSPTSAATPVLSGPALSPFEARHEAIAQYKARLLREREVQAQKLVMQEVDRQRGGGGGGVGSG